MVGNLDGKRYNLTGFEYGIAGACTGFITRFICQPLDVLKIRFQLQVTPLQNKEEVKYSSIIKTIRLIIKEEGFTSLWKGHIPAQFLSVTFGAVQFSTYEILLGFVNESYTEKHPWIDHIINTGCGSVAGLTATVVSFPFDVIRTYLIFQGEPKVFKGTLSVASYIYQKEGIKGFSRGLGASMIQTIPMSGLTFCFKGIYREMWLWFFSEVEPISSPGLSTSGVVTTSLLAGISAKTMVYPFDLMKKRLQIQAFNEKESCSKKIMKCTGIAECFLLTLKNEGFIGLFKGIIPSVLKSGIATAIYFTMFDQVCGLIEYMKS